MHASNPFQYSIASPHLVERSGFPRNGRRFGKTIASLEGATDLKRIHLRSSGALPAFPPKRKPPLSPPSWRLKERGFLDRKHPKIRSGSAWPGFASIWMKRLPANRSSHAISLHAYRITGPPDAPSFPQSLWHGAWKHRPGINVTIR